MTLKADLITALADFDDNVPEIRLSGAGRAGSLLKRNSLAWADVILPSVEPQTREKLLACLASLNNGTKDEQLSAINTAQRLLRATKTPWASVIDVPARKVSAGVRPSKIVRYVTICLKHGGRFYTVARRIDDFTLERCAVEPFTQTAGKVASAEEALADFEGKLTTSADWPGCPFCRDKFWMRHTCQGVSTMFCYGGQSDTTCPICKIKSTLTIKDVVGISTESVLITSPPRLGGPPNRQAIAGPSSKPPALPSRK